MHRRRALALCWTLLLLLPLLPVVPPGPPAGAAPAPFAAPRFESVWARTDQPVAAGNVARSWIWGPAPGEVRQEPFAGAPGGARTVQYFDKARMEVNPAVGAGPWATTTGLLVVELVSGRVQTGPDNWETRAPAEIPVAGDGTPAPALVAGAPVYRSFRNVASLPGGPDRRVAQATGAAVTATIDRAGTVGALPTSTVHYSAYAPETGHNIPDVFARFGQTQGLVNEGGTLRQGALLDPIYVLGYPISEAYWATVPIDGRPQQVLIQLYQRRVLTYIPSFTPAWQVQMGNVGQHYFTWRYNTPVVTEQAAPPTATPAPPAPPAPLSSPDGFVGISGSQFVYGGQPVTLKGTNYWIHTDPFAGTWAFWDGPTALAELARARDLGVNTIRIGLPYVHAATDQVVWGEGCNDKGARCDHVNGWIANEMTQLLQIASVYGMKVIFVLFDWDDTIVSPGSSEYQKQMNYLQGVVTPFANDDRVLAWDIHNEPENYPTWQGGGDGPARVIDWIAHVAGAVHTLDRRHPVTVGVAHADSMLLAPRGRRLLDLVDFVSFHCYDAGGLRTQIDLLQSHTSKPILLQEMGWPTGPADPTINPGNYNEATQQFLYHVMLGDAKASHLAGVMQWTLQDFPSGASTGYHGPSYEDWFGLVRTDGSLKPAAADFAAYAAPILPSHTATNVPLTKTRRPPRP
jgi:hypothetical protein